MRNQGQTRRVAVEQHQYASAEGGVACETMEQRTLPSPGAGVSFGGTDGAAAAAVAAASECDAEEKRLLTLGECTWNEIEQMLRDALGTTAAVGPRRSLRQIGKESGFQSVCCTLHPDWQGGEPAHILPDTVVFKFSCSEGLKLLERMLSKGSKLLEPANERRLIESHNTETEFYRYIDGKAAGEETAAWLSVPRPILLQDISLEQPVGHIMMEFMEGYTTTIFEGLLPGEADQVLRVVARLQVMGVRSRMATNSRFHISPWRATGDAMLHTQIVQEIFAEVCDHFGAGVAAASQKLLPFIETIYDLDLPTKLTAELPHVICNGDLWPPNIIWQHERDLRGTRLLKSVVDWQWTHVGTPAEDLVFFLCMSLSGIERRGYWQRALEKLHGYMSEELGGAEVTYTIQELERSYRLLFPFLAVTVFARLAIIGRLSAPDATQRQAIAERLEALAEDALAFHLENLASSGL